MPHLNSTSTPAFILIIGVTKKNHSHHPFIHSRTLSPNVTLSSLPSTSNTKLSSSLDHHHILCSFCYINNTRRKVQMTTDHNNMSDSAAFFEHLRTHSLNSTA